MSAYIAIVLFAVAFCLGPILLVKPLWIALGHVAYAVVLAMTGDASKAYDAGGLMCVPAVLFPFVVWAGATAL